MCSINEKKEDNQISLFNNLEENKYLEEESELNLQKTIIELKNKYGKNAIIRGMNLEEGATTIARNNQIGGHNG